MNFTPTKVALAVLMAGGFATAQATTLLINTPTANVDIVVAPFAGTLLDTAITSISNPSYNGIARTAVYDSGAGLDFYYQFVNNASSKNGVERFTASDFSVIGAGPVNVFQTATAFGIFTTGTEKSDYADRTLPGVIAFSFVPNGASKVTPGSTSFIQVIRTNITKYEAGNFGLLDGYGDNARGFAPAVPEPETYALMLAGMAMVGFVARRRVPR
jgi:hypothetical protein